jgi:hypothetical protein
MATADTINSIRTHLTADYEALENIGAELENVDKNIENIAAVVNGIYDNIPKTPDTGTNLSLNTIKGKMNIIPKGNIEQETREGYNLFQAKLQTTTNNGITVTNNNDGTFTINGTNTSSSLTTFRLDQSTQNGVDNLQNYEDGTYTLDLGIQNENMQITLMQVNTWQQFIATGMNTRLKSGTITGATGMFIYIAIKGSATLNNVVIKPMFVKGSYTTSTIPSFEEYGQMPSPSYPSDIEVVTGTQEVKVENKNLANNNTLVAGYIDAQGVWQQANEFRSTDYIEVVEGQTYSSSFFDNSGNRLQALVYATFDKDKNFIAQSTSATITIASGVKYIRCRNYQGQSNYIINNDFKYQVELGSASTSYIEHQEQTQTISLGDIELCKIGNYQDYLYKSNGKWYKKEQCKNIQLTSSLTWNNGGGATGVTRYYTTAIQGNVVTPPNNETLASALSNIGIVTATQTYNGSKLGVAIHPNGIIFIDSSIKDSLSSKEVWLYYVLATPNDIEITNETLIEQLDNLEKMKSYNGITNISSSGNLPIVLGVSALKGE